MPFVLRKRKAHPLAPRYWFSLALLISIHLTFEAASSPAIVRDNSDPSKELTAYAQRVEELRGTAIEDRHINYSQVLHTVYTRPIEAFLEHKKKWQRNSGSTFIFFTDYDHIFESASLSEVQPTRNQQLGSTLIGRYEAKANAIEIAHNASGFALVHESGHSLQRIALQTRREHGETEDHLKDDTAQLYRLSVSKTTYNRNMRRLRYLSAQDELEVRMQDLNRLYAFCNDGEPIMGPLDAVRALKLLGISMSEEDIYISLLGSEWQSDLGAIRELLVNTPSILSDSELRSYFEDAAELVMLQQIASQLSPELWLKSLRKIIFEAPGHL